MNTGVFVKPQPRAIATAINSLLRDDSRREMLADSAFERSRVAYAWPDIAHAYAELLKQAGRRSHAAP